MINEFYDNWAECELKNKTRESILKWKAVNLANIFLRSIKKIKLFSICEIGGAEGIVINTIADILNIKNRFVYDVSENFCEYGRSLYPETVFINENIEDNKNDFYDLMVLSDIIEHVKDDNLFLHNISYKCDYVALKIPIEKCLMNNRFFYFLRHGRKYPDSLRFGKAHSNGHLRGYNLKDAKKVISKYYNIVDENISDILYFYGSKKQILIRKIFGIKISVLLFGGALFLLGKSKNSK